MTIDITFSDYKKKDVHGIALYPATMVAPVQKTILKSLLNSKEISSVYDPFHGSGTSLYETALLGENIDIYGCDINPLANLITKVKLKGVSKNIYKNITLLEECISSSEAPEFKFQNIDKWFRNDIKITLSKIRQAIINIKTKKDRLYFWCVFSTFVRKYSNTRNETFKLHIKKQESIKRIKDNIIENFITALKSHIPLFKKIRNKIRLYKEDALINTKKFKDNSIDLLISSPPYGDNNTTVTYGQFSSLALFWIDPKDLELEGWELNNYSIIDSHSLGSKRKKNIINDFGETLLNPYLSNINQSKQVKVINFFDDYFKFLDEICRITKKYIVLTLGNRTVDGTKIDLTNITISYLNNLGFKNEIILNRRLLNKRIPSITSNVNNKSVSSMNDEYIIIHKK